MTKRMWLQVGFCTLACLAFPAIAMTAGPEDAPLDVVNALAVKCRPWIKAPSQEVQSLSYVFDRHGEKQPIEIVRGKSQAGSNEWRGITLNAGLEQMLRGPRNFEIEWKETDGANPILIARPKSGRIGMSAGNGVRNSWRGFFSSGSEKMEIELRAEDLLPIRETHDGNEFLYKEWTEVVGGQWAPMRVDVSHGDMKFRMQFQWRENLLWILLRSEYDLRGASASVCKVKSIVLNDKELIDRVTKEEKESAERLAIIKAMLERGKHWLEPELRGLESLEYTFRTVREDVDERCYLDADGMTVFEVSRDGKEKMKGSLGERKTIMPNHYCPGD